MKRVLFVSNGHGEDAIAARIAEELLARTEAQADHLALVGDGCVAPLHPVGPRRAMPSGGLVAMGDVRAIAADVRAGLLALTIRQAAFLRGQTAVDLVVAVGDSYALLLALLARKPTVFVGTAKSAFVAPYGPLERRLLRAARSVYVRDEKTAQRLRERGIAAQAANVIVDLPGAAHGLGYLVPGGAREIIGLLPGSRSEAYAHAARLCELVHRLGLRRPGIGALLSVAPTLRAERMQSLLEHLGWTIARPALANVAFDARRDGVTIRAWSGALGPLLAPCVLVVGQAGTANEAAAAAGIPVVALGGAGRRQPWYRRRQIALLGEAVLVVRPSEALREVRALLDDASRRARMAATGRERMGPPGAAARIAGALAGFLQSA